ncbi:MAG: aminotransferase class III-fold pyridoxal phosphate-dependent enzyme [Saprospiraceae bacterium]
MENIDLEISEQQAADYALKYYGINGIVKKLPGEVDFNFYLKNNNGKEYTLKIGRSGADQQNIDFQAKILNHLTATEIPINLPEVILTLNGKEYIELENDQYLRLQKWVPGRMLAEVNPRSPKILNNWGKIAGLLSKYLQGFDHIAAHRSYKWNPSEMLVSKKYRPYIVGEKEIEIADYCWDLFEKEALPILPTLRKSVNYNDAHEHNLLADFNLKNPAITGVIDFGDALFTETINELAIACAYGCMYLPDPLQAAANMVKGYHEVRPLEEKELAVLFPLILARLILTVTNSAWNKHHEPDNEYLLISEKPAWDLLQKFRKISPAFAHFTFRHACDLSPSPLNKNFKIWSENAALAPIINFANKKLIPFDLSVGSLDLGNNSNFENIHSFQRTINNLLINNEAEIGIGGYGEVRPFYTTDAYKVEGNSGAQWRTVHLGIDVWSTAGTPIYSPLDGEIYAVQNNEGDCNYGPTIILKHEIANDFIFYTLYGHLTIDSLNGLKKGMPINKGQEIAAIGPPPINGNWPPHLHFQVILDMLGNEGDFPGVAYPHEAVVWKSICPDPAIFFPKIKMPEINSPISEIIKNRKKSLGKSLSISYDEPLHIVRGYKQYLYDTTGRRFLDTVNNVAHVGHQHSQVVKAAQRQIGVLNTNTRYLHENITLFAEELLATLPKELSVVHFVNSGSDANELALRMVEAYTGQKDMIAVEIGYHGNTGRCIEISSYKFDGKGGKGAPPHTHIVPLPDIFRGIYKKEKMPGKNMLRIWRK